MNVFELAIVVAPLSGCIAAVRSASGHGPAVIAGCAVAGLVIGAVALLGPCFTATWLWSRRHDPDAPADNPGAVEWLAGTAEVLFAAFSPIISWLVAAHVVSCLL